MGLPNESSSPSPDADGSPCIVPEPIVIQPRNYQIELLNESRRRNIIIALDTGSGKTLIAILRMKDEVERQTKKISWFLAPTVTLIDQQRDVIARAIPVRVGSISGAAEPDQWKDASLWAKILKEYRIMVSTPQILLNALHHGYLSLGRDIGLIVFDEAHHAVDKHPYNMIMQAFYHSLPPREDLQSGDLARPAVLGLTASPIYGGQVQTAFQKLERNLDSVICSSRHNRSELAEHVHRPIFRHVIYQSLSPEDAVRSKNVVALRMVIEGMNIEDDPYVISLRSQLARTPAGVQRDRVDQQLSKTLLKLNTFTHKGLRDFERAASDICCELGPWAADWYITTVMEQAKAMASLHTGIMASWKDKEKRYLLDVLAKVKTVNPSAGEDEIVAGLSPKVRVLLDCLREEERAYRSQEDAYSGIIFVTRRDTVLALGEILTRLSDIKRNFRVGCLLGNSSSAQRHAFLDITRTLLKESASKTLDAFKIGDKNVVVSTSVAEEGIDIQACGSVIRFDPPPNMVAWAQSRGRARRQRSTFILMLDEAAVAANKIAKWEQIEREVINHYTDDTRIGQPAEYGELDEHIEFRVPTTGALLTLDSAISHLYHFCAVLPHSGHGSQIPIFDLDPPDFEEGWHSLDPRSPPQPYLGPWGALCTLPRQLPANLRNYSTDRVYPTKQSAITHTAFFAYLALYDAGLLSDNLLPLTSTISPDADGEVKLLLQEIEKRAGTAKVPIQLDPWAVSSTESQIWWFNEVTIGDLPTLYMFTLTQLPVFSDDELPTLYIPGEGAVSVKMTSDSAAVEDEDVITTARHYTKRMFNAIHGSRMQTDNSDFCYLFLPKVEPDDENDWKARREWMQERIKRSDLARLESGERANADLLGRKFGYTLDLALVRSNEKFGTALRFIGWHDGPISGEEAEELLDRYDGFPDMAITYPLIVAQPLPRRANFLSPLVNDTEGLSNDPPYLLHPRFATVDLIGFQDVRYSLLLPSLIRFLSIAITVNSMRTNLLSSTKLRDIPFSLLRMALTAPVSQEPTNYQRLETLGDTVLKYITGIQLFSQYPLWHEGYLSRRKDHAVNNNRLAKDAVRTGVERWMIRDRFVPRKWVPRYAGDSLLTTPKEDAKGDQEPMDVDTDIQKPEDSSAPQESGKAKKKKKKKEQTQQLSKKMMADVVESLIGASYEHGGFELAIECVKLFDLGMPKWDAVTNCVEVALSRVEEIEEIPAQLALVEKMVGYEFTRKTLLIEALTHASYTGDIQTVSYERLEFLGDSALDMVVTDYLYHAPDKNYTPGHMHIRKEALVNSHLLGYLCVNTSLVLDASMPTWTQEEGVVMTSNDQRIHLFQCMLHSSTRVLEDQNVTFARYEKSGVQIQAALEKDFIYPWAALTSLQAPKFISDMLESILGAVFLDSHGSLDVVRQVLRKLGIMAIMERIVADEVDVLHPVSRLTIWAAKRERKWEIISDKTDGDAVCIVKIDEEEVSRATQKFRGKVSVNEVRFAAAEDAIRKLHVREQEETADLDEADWGDVPDCIW